MPSRISARLARIVAFLLLVVASLTTSAQSQETSPRSNTTGLLVGLFLNGNSIDSDELDGMSARVASQDDAIIAVDGSSQTGDLEMAGSAITFGGGFHYFVAPTLALGANLQISTGKFSTVEIDNVEVEGLELDATSSRLNLGLTWYPVR